MIGLIVKPVKKLGYSYWGIFINGVRKPIFTHMSEEYCKRKRDMLYAALIKEQERNNEEVISK